MTLMIKNWLKTKYKSQIKKKKKPTILLKLSLMTRLSFINHVKMCAFFTGNCLTNESFTIHLFYDNVKRNPGLIANKNISH